MVNDKAQNSIHSGRLLWYLLLVAVLSAFCYVTLHVWLMPYSVAYSKTGAVSVGYVLYVIIGLLFSTPTPFIAVLIISLIRDKISVKQLFLNIMHTENKGKTILITGSFCLFTLIYAVLYGKPNGTAWYMLPILFIVMIPFVGIA